MIKKKKESIRNTSVRKWLKKREIFFTTACTVLLSIMAIIVSCIANRIASRQYQIEYFEKQPDFQIIREQIFNTKTLKYEDTRLIVNKLSGKAKNIEVETITLLNVRYTNTNNSSKSCCFLIDDYFNTSLISDATNSTVLILEGYKNNSKIIELENYIERMIENQSQFVYCELRSFAQIKYLNFELEPKVEYFDVSSINGKLINNDTLDKYFNKNLKLFKKQNTIHLRDIRDENTLTKIISKIK